jgi:hypothetical protein
MTSFAFKSEAKAVRWARKVRGRRSWKRKLPGGGAHEMKCPPGSVMTADVRPSQIADLDYPFTVDVGCRLKGAP